MEKFQKSILLIARILVAHMFILTGFSKITDWSGSSAYMAQHGLPLIPLLLIGAIVVELAGGIALAIGFKAKLSAGALALFMIPTTLVFHQFWAAPPEYQMIQMAMFMKNMSMIGGLLLIVGYGAGPFSIDGKDK